MTAYMTMLTNPTNYPCEDMASIEECYNEEDGECFFQKERLGMARAAAVAVLGDGSSEEQVKCGEGDDDQVGYSLFTWLEFVQSDNNCSDDDQREADDDLDSCVETETKLFYQEMVNIPGFAKKIWSCSVLERTVWKCVEKTDKLAECFSHREKGFIKTQLSSLISSVFRKERCSFLPTSSSGMSLNLKGMGSCINIFILLGSTNPPPVKSISSNVPVVKVTPSYDFSFSDYEEEDSYDDQDIVIQQEDEVIQIAEGKNDNLKIIVLS